MFSHIFSPYLALKYREVLRSLNNNKYLLSDFANFNLDI